MDFRPLDDLCQSFRRQLRSALIQAGLCRVALVGLVLLPPILLLDWLTHFSMAWRFVALGGYLAALSATAWWTLISPMKRRWSNEEIFARLDEVLPGTDGTLLELHELIRGKGIEEASHPLGQTLVSEAVRQLSPLTGQAARVDAIHRPGVARWRNAAGIAIIIFAAAAVPLATYLSIGCKRLFNPLSSVRWPHRTTIALHTPLGGFAVPQLESLDIRADVSGVVPPDLVLAFRGSSGGYWIKEKIPIRPDGSIR